MKLALGRLGSAGTRTLIQRAIASLRARGSDAHLWLPGVGTINGLTTGNYLESTGNTLATVDNPTGLVLDALGGQLGDNIVVNGGFDDTSWWSVGGGAAISSGALRFTSAANESGAYKTNLGTVGKYYEVSFEVVSISSGAISVGFGTSSSGNKTSPGVYTQRFGAANAALTVYSIGASTTAVVDNISVREVTGIHAQQATTQNKPLLRRGLTNLLTYSSDLSNAAWTVVDSATKTATTCTFAANATSTVNNLCVVSGGTASKTFTAAVKVSCASGTVPFRIKNTHSAVLDSFSGEMLATTTPTIFVFTVTNSGSAGNGIQTIGLINSAVTPVVNTLTVDGVGLFQGSYTSQQIIAAGGIPVTTTAAASNPDAGKYSWAFDSTDVLSATIPAGWETATVIDAAPTGAMASVQNVVGTHSLRGAMVTGVNLVTNGGFDGDTGWTKVAGVTISGGVASFAAVTNATSMYQGAGIQAGKTYFVSIDCVISSGSVSPMINGAPNTTAGAATTSGIETWVMSPTNANGNFSINASAFTGSIDNISVYEINPVTHARILVKGTLTDAETDLYKSLANSFK